MHGTEEHVVGATVTAVHFLCLIPLLPFLGAASCLLLGRRLGHSLVGVLASGVIAGSFFLSLYAFLQLTSLPSGAALIENVYPWIHAGSLQIDVAFRVDALSAVMLLIVTGVGFLIHLYSLGYMHDEPRFSRYFGYLNLFTGAMLVLVLADSLPLLFVGWEGVGLCSYLLIGFWFSEEANAIAGKKAFVVNRIGDAGFLLGTFLLFWSLGDGPHSLRFTEIAQHVAEIDPTILTIIGLLFFVGATGKSAQLPLFVWLPDAMAGPTPVSALIHAATMVTAGVYLIARMNFLYLLTPTAMSVIAIVGAATALFAATIGLMQQDIKKVLAYSTVSQLGYMFLAVGVGAFGAGILHVMTHAFFKGLLFLGSGSVIHGMGGEQDMRKMGGLREIMPTTYRTFLIGTLAIAGIPGLAGFFSKDAILAATVASGNYSLWVVGVVAAGMTSFYMFRLLFLTFFGECRADEGTRKHIHESPSVMTIPLMVLAFLSIVGGYVAIPLHALWGDLFGEFLSPVLGHFHGEHLSVATELGLMAASVGVAIAGAALAYLFYIQRPDIPASLASTFAPVHRLVSNKYYIDEIYDAFVVAPILAFSRVLWRWIDVGVIDAVVNGTAAAVQMAGDSWRRLQSGNVQHYAAYMLFGAIVLLGFYGFR